MPLTTPFFPLTASQPALSSSPSSSSSSSSSSSPSAPHPVDSPHCDSSATTTTTTTNSSSSTTHDAPLSSPFAPPPYAVPSGLLPLAFPPTIANPKSSSSSRPPSHGRRYTLSRLPLLRKGSRELSRSSSALSIRNTASHNESTDSPFVATGAPRASSSISRGRNTIAEHSDSEDDKDDCTRTQSRASRAGYPDKMHQTSSRLLRMTDDERPFTRVRINFSVLSISDFVALLRNDMYCPKVLTGGVFNIIKELVCSVMTQNTVRPSAIPQSGCGTPLHT
jgi:GTPase-activating protein SST2